MANQPSSYPILCASFNQDASLFAIGTRDGFRIFDSNNGRLCHERALGAFNIVEMLFSSNLVAIVGAGEQPSLSPRRLCLFNTMSGNALRELNFLTSILAVRMNRKRLVVLLQDKTYIYDINSITILDEIETVPNLKVLELGEEHITRSCIYLYGSLLCKHSLAKAYMLNKLGFDSEALDGCFLGLPASITKGSLLLYNVMELQLHCEIEAHRAPLAIMALSSNGMYIATASEQGTMIRVHLVSEATKSYSFRRGSYPSTIFSLSFGSCSQVPEILVATSSSGSVHVLPLGFAIKQRSSRRSGGFLGSIMPDSLSDALDPANHHIIHNAVPAGIKSYALIRKVERVADASSSEIVVCRATLAIITYNGYFQEYNLSLNNQNEFSRSLDREFNLMTAISDSDVRL